MFSQLWHVGRQSHVDLQPDGGLPVGPSEVYHENVALTPDGWMPASQNRALTVPEIQAIIEDFRKGAENARKQDLMAWNSMQQTATWWTSFYRTFPIINTKRAF